MSLVALAAAGFAIGAFAAAARLVLQQPFHELPERWQHDHDFRASLAAALFVISVGLLVAFLV